jgi:hypothetical protein
MQRLKLQTFVPTCKSFINSPKAVIIGRRKEGKSWLMKDLLFHLNDIQRGIIFHGLEDSQHFYNSFVSPESVHTKFNKVDALELLRKQQVDECLNNTVVVMDDVIYDMKIKSDIVELFSEANLNNTSLLLSMQYSFSGLKDKHVDYAFIFKDKSIVNLKCCYEHYAGMFPTFESFIDVISSLNKYECLVIHLSSESKRVTEQVFKYKASSHDDFRLIL